MTDVHDKATRSRNMAAIKGKDTKPEVWLRKNLFREGFRFRLHRKDLPGKPDIVFPRYNAVIFLHGCFWHGHDCHLFRLPASRTEFWRDKIESNRQRDSKNVKLLSEAGWRVLEIWECSIKGKERKDPGTLLQFVMEWLRSESPQEEVRGGSTENLKAL